MFTVSSSKKKFNANDVTFGGRYPYVVRTSDNNGIRGFINEDIKYLNDGKTISFGQDTATIFYQELPYFTGDKIKVLSPKFKLDKRIAVYLLSCMRKSFSNFQWGVSSFNEAILKSIEIKVPIAKDGEIDFSFMQARIQEMEQARIQEMDAYLKVAGFENCELTDEERDAICKLPYSNTNACIIGDLFNLKKGKRLTKANMASGTINFIGSSASNNGITAQISNNQHVHDGNKITVTYNGSVGEAFYQTDSFWASDDVNVLTFKQNLNERLALFFCTALRKRGKQYEYTYKWTKELMEKDSIILPVTSSGEIDYHFMETYIRAQEKLAIQRVKDWRAKEIDATREVVYADTAKLASTKQSVAHVIYIPSSEIAPSQRYITHLPVYPLRAACGYFDECGSLPEDEAEGWLDVSGQLRHLNKDMYIVHAEGRSMEPKIHDGDLCVFKKTAGSRQGKIVLAKAKDELDPDAGSYTIKQYSSESKTDEDGRNIHTRIVLSPLNPEFQPIVLEAGKAEEEEFQIYGELIRVITHDI